MPLNDKLQKKRILEVTNGTNYTLEGYLRMLAGGISKPVITVPDALARSVAWFCDICHVTAFSLGHYEILKYDNCPKTNDLPALMAESVSSDHNSARKSAMCIDQKIEKYL